ncbi:hypothetical protein [Actinomadura rupiterrae]|uniref:hypothetical protein n=1 Tax=Actinomadura rupiterrae TaxID=559627 RepID=UPI0020A2E05F|nr:hypothetical protein [Actinomadura rupiterrae]MCP2342430.1 hypothetical protein [Actinomadura rupiterrae]
MDRSALWDRYGTRWTGLTAEEIDEALAMLEDSGAARDTYLRTLARLLARLSRGSQDTPGTHRRRTADSADS